VSLWDEQRTFSLSIHTACSAVDVCDSLVTCIDDVEVQFRWQSLGGLYNTEISTFAKQCLHAGCTYDCRILSFSWSHLSLGKMEDCTDDTRRDPDTPRCSRKSSLANGLFLFYAFITTIMLINLLIAIFRFCYTLSSLQSCSLTFSSPSSGSVLRSHHYNHAH